MESELLGLLSSLLNPDPSTIHQISTILKDKYYNEPMTLVWLGNISLASVDLSVRQFAAVEMRKLVDTLYPKLDPTVCQTLVHHLLNFLSQEKPTGQDLLFHSLARVVCEILKNEMTLKRMEILPLVYEMCQSHQSREMGVYLIYVFFDVMDERLEAYIPQLFSLLSSLVANEQEALPVLVHSIQALGRIADFILETDAQAIKNYQALIPHFVRVLKACLDSGSVDNSLQIFEVFDALLTVETPLLKVHFVDLIHFYLGVCGVSAYGSQVRVMALSFIMFCTIYKKSELQKKGLLSPILAAMMPIGAEDEPADRDEDYPAKIAFQVINSLATNFSSTKVLPLVMEHVSHYLQGNSGQRKSALLAIGVLVDGCADNMRYQSDQVISIIVNGLRDSDVSVQRAACLALGSLAEELDIEVNEHHATIIPLLYGLLENPNCEPILPEILSSLDILLEHLDDAIQPYAHQLMNKLVVLLENGPLKVQVTAMNCIGSVAHSSGAEFSPYFEPVLNRIHMLMAMTDREDITELRSVATDAAGAVAQAVGKERFAPFVQNTMSLAVTGLESDESRLLECSFTLFGVLARVFGEDFSPFLPLILPRILKSCSSKEKDWNEVNDATEEDLDDEDEEEGMFSMAAAHEKQSSLDALAELFDATRGAFMPYAKDSLDIVIAQFDHYYEGCRTSAVQCALRFYTVIYDMAHKGEWLAGLPLKAPLDPQVAQVAQMIIPKVNEMLLNEEDRMVLSSGFQSVVDTLKTTGPSILSVPAEEHALDSLAHCALSVLRGEHACQDDIEADDDVAELDSVAISSAADLVAALCAALTDSFIPYFSGFLPELLKFSKPSRSTSDRSMAIGALAECAQGLESAVSTFTQQLLTLFMKGIQDPEEEVQSNAAFGLGVLIINTKLDLSSQYPQILMALRPLFEPTEVTNRIDNACGAVSRMILKSADAVPMDQVLPVLLSKLPLKKDYEENEPIYKSLLYLLKHNHPFIMQQLPSLLPIFAQVLEPKEQLKEELRVEMVGFLNSLKSQPDQFMHLLQGMDGAFQTRLMNLR